MVVPNWVHETLLVSVVVFAWWKGGRWEQTAASVGLITILLYYAISGRLRPGTTLEAYDLVIVRDSLQALLFVGLALRADRYWAIAAASVSVVSVAVAASQLVRPVQGWTFWTAEIALMYLQLIAIVVGVCQTWAARRRAAAAT